jgi:hypothetical protein
MAKAVMELLQQKGKTKVYLFGHVTDPEYWQKSLIVWLVAFPEIVFL